MYLQKHLQANLLFVLILFTSNLIIAQSFFETYTLSQAPEEFLTIEETSTGFEMLLVSNPNLPTPTYVNVDASGNFLSLDALPAINNTSYTALDNGNFLQRTNTGPNAAYSLFDQNLGLLSTFTIPAPSGASEFFSSAIGVYSNGDLLLNFGYSGLSNSDFSILRVNPFSGQILWRQEIEFGWTNGNGFALEVVLTNDNESAYISVANTTNNLYFIVKMSASGNILLNEFFGTTSRIPRNFTASTDGGLWHLANALESFIFKINADGTEFTILTDPFFMSGTGNQELVATPDGGVMAIGNRGNGDTYTLRLSADGSVVNSTVLDDIPSQIFRTTAGTRLNSGGYIFGGDTANDGNFLLTVDQNGEFVTGGGGCNVNITSSNGGVTITGLTSDANTKLFDANTQAVWSCNPWQGNPCSANETVPNLISGATYFLSVQSVNCNEWIPITIQGGGSNPNCYDGIQNQGEAGIDCGGPCAPCSSGCNVNVTSSNGGVNITGLTSNANTKLFDSNTQAVWSCNPWQGNPCSANETVPNLIVGATYFLSVQSPACNEWIPITVQGNGGCTDSDNDGVCNADDCQPTNPSLPTTPGSSCNDFNSNTTNDQIQSDGCTCQGTPVGGGCNVNITSSNGGVTITGLTSDANTKLFNSNTQEVWSCNPWQGNPCSSTETVSGLTVGATFFLSVQSSSCNEWIPITIQGGGGGGNGVDLTIANFTSDSGSPGDVVSFSFDLINAGNQTVNQSYNITTFISADNQLSSNDLQEGNIATGNTPPGTTPNVNGAVTIPSNFPPGSFWLIIKVDNDNSVQETNENNNVFATAFPIVDNSGECIAPINVANLKPATQSSTINFGGIDSGAANAVDGNIDGNYFNGSVAATNESNQAWWQVDLGGFFDVFSVEIYNRTDGNSRLNDFYVMTSATPFTSGLLSTARNIANNETFIPGQAGLPSLWFTNSSVPVRYVRVQRAGNGFLTLAELRVNGCPINNLNDDVTQSFEAPNEVTTPSLLVQNLFPNPTFGELFTQIESTTDQEISIQVVNILGQVKLERKMQVEVGMNALQLQLDYFENGIYNVIIHDGERLVSKQFVISK